MIKRRHPVAGAYVPCETGGASASPRGVYVELDPKQPRLHFQDEGGAPRKAFAFEFPKGKTEREIFDVTGYALKHEVVWRVEFSFLIGDQRVVRMVPDSGYFVTTGPGRARRLSWYRDQWQRAPKS